MSEYTLDEVVLNETNRTIVDVVATEPLEFRASIYDADDDLIADGWGDTIGNAVADAWKNYGGMI